MRKITANIIYPVSSPPLKDAYLVIDDNGKIVDLVRYDRSSKEPASLEYYSGLLIPGFVNPRCKMDFSHIKGKIANGQGLKLYNNQVQSNETKVNVDKNTQKALRFMWSRGINGLGYATVMNLETHLWLGAESNSSSSQASIFDAMKTISIESPEMSFETLLSMATLQGAKALCMDKDLGSFDIGKQPGVLLVSGFDFKKQQLRKDSSLTRLV